MPRDVSRSKTDTAASETSCGGVAILRGRGALAVTGGRLYCIPWLEGGAPVLGGWLTAGSGVADGVLAGAPSLLGPEDAPEGSVVVSAALVGVFGGGASWLHATASTPTARHATTLTWSMARP